MFVASALREGERLRAGGSTYRVTVAETADGYTITRGGAECSVSIADDGSMTIEGDMGTWYVTQSDDGS